MLKYSDSNKSLYEIKIWEMDNAGCQAEGCAQAAEHCDFCGKLVLARFWPVTLCF